MAAAPAARKRPAPDEACPAEAGKKRALCQVENIDDYEMLEEIGEGVFGVATKARDRRTGETVAVKSIRGACFVRSFATVLRVAGCCLAVAGAACRGHPGPVQVKGVATDETTGDQYQLIAMELAGLTSLRSRLTPPQQRFSEVETSDAMRQLLREAEQLHATGTVHRDINPDNILVGPDGGALKICAFGRAAPASPVGKTCPEKKPVGTLRYRSPEQLIRARRYGPEVDMWALGCVMAELLTVEPLFTAATEDDVLEQVVDLRDDIVTMGVEAFDDGMPDLSLAGRELLVGLLSFDSDERLTATDALKHRWFSITEEDVVA